MPQDTSSFDDVLKNVYEGGIRELIPTKVKTLDLFREKDAREWGGREIRYPVRIGRNQGVGFGSEGGQLPAAGKQQYTTVSIPMRFQYGRIRLTGQVLKASQGARNAFASAMEQEMDGLIRDLTADMGRAICYDGRGILALANGDPGTTTSVVVDSPGGVAGATNGSRFINPDMLVAFIAPATGALVSGGTAGVERVSTVPAAGTNFTTTTTVTGTIADNDYVVRAMTTATASAVDTSYQKESMGLLGLIDDGTYVATLHGVNRTSYPLYQSAVIASVGAVSADVLQRGIDLADQRGDGEIDTLIMHHSVRRSYLASMEGDRRYTSGDLSRPDAGTVAAKRGGLTFGGIRIMEEKYAPYGIVFGLDSGSAVRYTLAAGEWMDEDGAILSRVGSGNTAEDSFEGVYRVWQNFHLEKPNTCFRLDGVTATVAVAHID